MSNGDRKRIPSIITAIVILALVTQTGCFDKITWKGAQRLNTPSAFAMYLNYYPNGKFASEARNRVKTFEAEALAYQRALAVVECIVPPTIDSVNPYIKAGYLPVQGPVWVYPVEFSETNGVGANITSCRLEILVKYGYWTNQSDSISTVRIEPHGKAKYESWVSSLDGKFRGKILLLTFSGADDNGHPISITIQSLLK